MAKDVPSLIGAAIGLLALVGLGEMLRHTYRISAEASRRLIHVATGLFAALVPFIFRRPDLVYVLASAFALVNLAGVVRGWFPSMHGVQRRSVGTITFPLALIVAVASCWSADPGRVFVISVAFLILAISDPLASFAGNHLERPGRFQIGYGIKSVAGSTAFFVSAFVLSTSALWWFQMKGVIDWTVAEVVAAGIGVAAVTTAVEALSGGGWDNFFIIVAALVFLVYFDEHPDSRYAVPGALGVGVLFAAVSVYARLLDTSGAVAGGLLAASVVGLGGGGWAVPSFAFFILSSLLSKLGGRLKAKLEAQYEKGSVRDAGQVYANGGVGWAMLLAYAIRPEPILYWAFLGAFAAAAADTWATEVGALSRARPWLITTFQKAPAGTSGAVSIWGLVGALTGAVVVWLIALPFLIATETGIGSIIGGVAVITGGVVASLVDSVVGATIQAQYIDPHTGGITERPFSEGVSHAIQRGFWWMRNDQVNVVCTLFGALFAAMCYAVAF